MRIAVSLLSILVAIPLMASDNTARQKQLAEPLLLRILIPESTICLGGRYAEAEVELRNVSDRPVLLSAAGVGSQVSIISLPCSLDDGIRATETDADPLAGVGPRGLVTLKPGESLHKQLRVTLAPGFFMPGVYRATVGYSGKFGGSGKKGAFLGILTSNEVLFEIRDCAEGGRQEEMGPAR